MEPEQPPFKRPKIMNTPPAEIDERDDQAFPLLGRNITNQTALVTGNERALTASWERLVHQLREEVDAVTQAGPDIIPVIDFEDLSIPRKARAFFQAVQKTGTAIIRNVIPPHEAAAWTHDLDTYLRDNPHTQQASPPADPELYELFWSLAQLNSRGHPNILAAQEAVMSGCWHHSDAHRQSKEQALISTRFPVAYADRVRMTRRSLRGSQSRVCRGSSPVSSLDLTEEPDAAQEHPRVEGFGGCLEGETYRGIRAGEWAEYDPWDSGARLDAISGCKDDNAAGSVFKMFEGILPLSGGPPDDDDPPRRLCPLPLKLTTAYRVLRPLFAPKRALTGSREEFLSASNWVLDPAAAALHRTRSPDTDHILHPHLELDKTLLALPPLSPGDYVLFHPDTIHAHPCIAQAPAIEPQSQSQPQPLPPSPEAQNNDRWSPAHTHSPLPPPAKPETATTATTTLHLPCTPLTLTTATYLARQRRAFILGLPAPDFLADSGDAVGESCHMGRPGVQEVNEAGGEAALRAMGLLAWEVDEARDDRERRLLEGANAILFPDGY